MSIIFSSITELRKNLARNDGKTFLFFGKLVLNNDNSISIYDQKRICIHVDKKNLDDEFKMNLINGKKYTTGFCYVFPITCPFDDVQYLIKEPVYCANTKEFFPLI